MYKRKKFRKLGLKKDQRKALLRSQTEALFLKEKIQTTEAKAKEISVLAEKFITKAKNSKSLSVIRNLARFFSEKIVKKLTSDMAGRYATRNGGYTRIIKLGRRKRDGARIVIIELVK